MNLKQTDLLIFIINLKRKGSSMKEGLIEARVNKLTDISQKIKDFIQEKTAHQASPFQNQESANFNSRSKSRAKRSLTDWRQLYSRNQNKIIPRHTVYPATADGQRIRCTLTGQCNRRRAYSSAKSKNYQGERNFQTRQSRRQKQNEVKRQSVVQFAFAQNIYQNDVLKDQNRYKNRDKRFYIPKHLDSKRENYCRVGEYLSLVQAPSDSVTQLDATEQYIRKHKETANLKVSEYNFVKIREDQKLNNARFLDSLQLMNRRKRNLHSQNGLRFYQRA